MHLLRKSAHTHTHLTFQHMQPYTYGLIYRIDRHTHSSPASACGALPQLRQIVAELLQYATCFGEHEGGRRRLGSGSRLSEDVCSLKLLGCLGSPPLNNCLSLHTPILQTPAGAKSYLGRAHTHTGRSDLRALWRLRSKKLSEQSWVWRQSEGMHK